MPYKDLELRRKKACEYTKLWRIRHRESYLIAHCAQQTKWNREHKEIVAEKNKRYYQANKQKYYAANKKRIEKDREAYLADMRERSKLHYQNNKAKYAARVKKRRIEKPEVMRQAQAARRARIRGNGGTFSLDDLQRLKKVQKGKCYWCKSDYGKYEVDHVIPIVRGGSNGPENIVLSCMPCNRSKGAKMPIALGRLL